MLYLLLVVIWTVVAVGLYVYHATGHPGQYTLPLSGLAALMAMYDMVRWWGWRTQRNQRRETGESMFRHRPLHRPGDDRDPDPTFRFTDQPADQPPKADGGAGETGPK